MNVGKVHNLPLNRFEVMVQFFCYLRCHEEFGVTDPLKQVGCCMTLELLGLIAH